MNNGVVIVEPICHMTSRIATPNIFFILITSINFVLCLFDVCIISHIFNLSRGFVNLFLAGNVGFEPTDGSAPSTDFKSAAFDHSANSPY